MILLLMAAGRGSRYGKLKQFDSLGPKGEFLMEFSIYDALKNGFTHIVIITQADQQESTKIYFQKRLPKHIVLDVIVQKKEDLPEGIVDTYEREKPWGTAHAVWSARHIINKPFAVLNADDFYGVNAFKKAFDFYKNSSNDTTHALIGYTLNNTLSENGSVSRGICKLNGKQLISIEECLQLQQNDKGVIDLDSEIIYTGDEQVSMNFWVCKPSLFKNIENAFRLFLLDAEKVKNSELYLPVVIQETLLAQLAAVELVASESNWFGVTYADDREKAVAYLKNITKEGKYPSPLWPNSNA